MDFALNEEQRAIEEMATSLFHDTCSDDFLRDFVERGDTSMDELWASCIETGLHSLYIPESAGGSGLGMTELMLVLQAQGSALGLVPLWRHQLAATVIAEYGDEALMPTVLAAAEGGNLLSVADPSSSPISAKWHGDSLLVSGTVNALAEANRAETAVIKVNLDGEIRLLALPIAAEGITLIEGVMTQGEKVADVECKQVTVPAVNLLAADASAWLQPRAIAALCAQQLGISEHQLKRTVEYISERRQFERQIGAFQAVQMTMADCRVALEALRSSLWQLVYRLDADLGCDSEALATAFQASEAGHLIGHKAQHVHGGFGVDITYPIHRYLYWSRAIRLALGGSGDTLAQLGDWLNDNDKLGWKYDLDENH
ncbi:acyl-CoA/acyl-ACP dehydrogenase [Shewanella submarina]|uniref:Acyl-CoA dehydrogenase family protein n=1 Tax=Shewanella submarina TaxID=2016376 RepID=A0ABV7GHG6_9GAMM|nr:acyl-CoA dehydrogenase family protein [Shewanella submarina]MCL1038101.1 acyl-CoA/acyl-ACP dehydrogenase [Shewanella submarina]